jgi:rare lipoprotein A
LPPAHIHYEVGAAYKQDGVWLYPRQEFAWRESGLAVVDADTSPHITADGEIYDPTAMTGAHPTLQLPVQVTVRNLDNGRQIEVRLNDRGPKQRGRLISLTPQAAAALGMGRGPARVEVIENELPSRLFAETLPGGPLLDMKAAPVGTVQTESLDMPAAPKTVPGSQPETGAQQVQPASLPSLPVVYTQGWATPGSLWIEVGRFTQRSYAAIEAARAGGTVSYASDNNGPGWVVRVGPFTSVADADAALDQALTLGLTGAHIVVE